VPKALMVRVLREQTLADGRSTRYSCGWAVVNEGGIQRYSHGGLIAGFHGEMIRIPQLGVFIVVLSNCEGIAATQSALAIEALVGDKPTTRLKVIELRESEFERYVGTYLFGPGDRVEIERQGDHLIWVSGRGRQRIFLHAEGGFSLEHWPTVHGRFCEGSSGSIVGLIEPGRLGPSRANRVSDERV
jgi:hypothetical protein